MKTTSLKSWITTLVAVTLVITCLMLVSAMFLYDRFRMSALTNVTTEKLVATIPAQADSLLLAIYCQSKKRASICYWKSLKKMRI